MTGSGIHKEGCSLHGGRYKTDDSVPEVGAQGKRHVERAKRCAGSRRVVQKKFGIW